MTKTFIKVHIDQSTKMQAKAAKKRNERGVKDGGGGGGGGSKMRDQFENSVEIDPSLKRLNLIFPSSSSVACSDWPSGCHSARQRIVYRKSPWDFARCF